MKHASFFTGIGGFDLAAEWAGWENVFQVEIDPWCRKVLKKNFPHAKRYSDIREFDGTPYRGTVDVVSGGFPCQPFSLAGKRKGTGDERHLWPEMLRVIQEVAPTWVVGENVRGIVSWSDGLVFEQVCADLEAAGYKVQSFILPASGVNAPHCRQRVWFVAHLSIEDDGRGIRGPKGRQIQQSGNGAEQDIITDTENVRRQRGWSLRKRGARSENNSTTTSHPNGIGHERSGRAKFAKHQAANGKNETNISFDEFPRQTESPVCGVDDGLPHRLDRIRGLGNAIVPQVAYRIFDTINQYEKLANNELR